MIIAIGEILADLVGQKEGDSIKFSAFAGGAPFNVAVNAKQAGAKVGFIGKVGKDPLGKFLIEFTKKANFDYTNIQVDDERNTTLAFVTLTDGERDFAFHRHDTADFNVDVSDMNFESDEISIVHLGSLMLSEQKGRNCADKVIEKARKSGKIISFDVNLRMDLYDSLNTAINIYKKYVNACDIVKFSDDEILSFTQKEDLNDAIQAIYKENTLLIVTLGSKGSFYKYNEICGKVASEKVKPIDTTGAGDSFFGTFLAKIENKEWTRENVESALKSANEAGARTTQFFGAVKL